jgi:hypothetical protein
LNICLIVFLLTNGAFYTAVADHEEHKESTHHNKKRKCNKTEHHENENLLPVNNSTYIKNCGSCHLAYQPGLLPPVHGLKFYMILQLIL